jgi:hypothetical protein
MMTRATSPESRISVEIPLEESIQEIRAALVHKALSIRHPYRNFMIFLDLKQQFHRTFMTEFWSHAEEHGFTWGVLLYSEGERKRCARSFLSVAGPKYWQSEENRRKYLIDDSKANPVAEFRYPEMTEE